MNANSLPKRTLFVRRLTQALGRANAMSKPSFHAAHSDGSDATQELLSFAELIGLESTIPGRYSVLLLLQLFGATQSGMLSPAKVISQIRALEGLKENGGLKVATPFKHPPLQGLWHQHYLEDSVQSTAINIRKGLFRFGLPWVEQRISDAKASNEKGYFTLADVPQIVNDALTSNWERLKQHSALTGEWIVFAKHEGSNYYLSLSKHNGDHLSLRNQIDAICLHEFPFLDNVLGAKSA